MLQFLSNALSAPAIAAAVSIAFSLNSQNFALSTLLGILLLSVFPILPIFYFSRKGATDMEVHERKKRTFFFLMAIAGYILSSAVFYFLNYHSMFFISLAYIFVTTAVMLVNIFWKISVHSAGVAGPTTALVYVFGLGFIPLYILTVLVILVRLKLKAHTLPQLMVGALMAIAITFLTYFFFY